MTRCACLLLLAPLAFAQDLETSLAQLQKDLLTAAPQDTAARLETLCARAETIDRCEAWAYAAADALQNRETAPALAADVAMLNAMRGIRGRLSGADAENAGVLVKLGEAYVVAGNYAAAEPPLLRALEIQKARRLENGMTAIALNDLAMVRETHADYTAAIALYRQALDIRRQVFGPASPIVAEGLINLAGTYETVQNMRQAETLARQALAILDKLGPAGRRTAAACMLLGDIFETEGNYPAAEPFYRRALALTDSFDHDSPDTATALDDLASLYGDEARYREAMPLRLRALRISREKLGPEHPDTAARIHNLGTLYYRLGDYRQAEENYQQALALREKVLPAENPDIAATMDSLAQAWEALGEFGKAEPLYRRALALREKKLGENHQDTGRTMNNLGVLYLSLGDYPQAERMLTRAVAISEKAQPPNPVETSSRLGNLAYLYGAEGDYARAEPLWNRVIEMRRKALGAGHPDTAGSVLNLAELYYQEKKYPLAERLYQQALLSFQISLPPGHPDLAVALNGLAAVYLDEKEYGKAQALLDRSLAFRAADQPGSAYTWSNLGKLNFARGNFAESETDYSKSLTVFRESSASDHPDAIAVRIDGARALWQTGNRAAARDQLIEANRELLRFWSSALVAVEEARRRSLVQKFDSLLPLSLSMARELSRQDPDGAARLSALAIMTRKGVQSSARQEVFARLQRDRNPEALALLRRLAANAEQQGRAAREPESQSKKRLAELAAEENKIERQLIEKSPAFRKWRTPLEPEQIGQALAPDTALVDLIRYPRLDLASGALLDVDYAAAVYRAGAPPQLVWLGAAGPIDAAVASLRANFDNIWNTCLPEDHCGDAQRVLKQGAAFAENLRHTEADCATLYRLTMARLLPAIGGRKRLLISPDGALAEIPWDLLRNGAYLVEKGYRIRYLDSARNVETPPQAAPQSSAVVIADVDYDGHARRASAETTADAAERPAGAAAKWLPLHGGDEILRTLADLEREGKIGPVEKLPYGSEEELMALRRPAAIFAHTHGFFSARPEPFFEGLDSGIVLYGANRAGDPDRRGSDGWLMAKEAMLLHLEGTQLVALLGCDTGLGAEAGEGVQGLRHALAVAGARSTLLTLWDVGDLSSARFLRELLIRLASGASLDDALAETRLAFLRGAVRERGAPNRWSHPYFWAAPTLSGEGGKINLRSLPPAPRK